MRNISVLLLTLLAAVFMYCPASQAEPQLLAKWVQIVPVVPNHDGEVQPPKVLIRAIVHRDDDCPSVYIAGIADKAALDSGETFETLAEEIQGMTARLPKGASWRFR